MTGEERAVSCLRVAVLVCKSCGAELRRSRPFQREHEPRVLATAPLEAARCPNGCIRTQLDAEAYLSLSVKDAPPEERLR